MEGLVCQFIDGIEEHSEDVHECPICRTPVCKKCSNEEGICIICQKSSPSERNIRGQIISERNKDLRKWERKTFKSKNIQ